MQTIIKENERGFLYRNGIYVKMLTPGKQRVSSLFGETVAVVAAKGRLSETLAAPSANGKGSIETIHVNLNTLRKDNVFAAEAAVIDVPDGHLALRFADGRIAETLRPGTYAYWNIVEQNRFELVDITDPASANNVPVPYIAYMPNGLVSRVDVSDGEACLLYYNSAFQRVLAPGRYFFWNYNTKVTQQTVDMRVQALDISGQEILTADKVSLRINFVCTFKVLDAVAVVSNMKDYKAQLYTMVQLVLREFAGKYRFDDLLRQKDSIGGYVLDALKAREAEYSVCFTEAGVKDIILPGEIRDIMNTVLVAEKSAQASVITRREEIAATKSLLDTARLMDENATLFKLKELEYLERICDKVGSISVDGGSGVLKALRELVSAKG